MDEQPEQIRGAREGLGIIKHLRAMGASPGEALEVLRRHREEIVAQAYCPPRHPRATSTCSLSWSALSNVPLPSS
jgi:hypothetical protein